MEPGSVVQIRKGQYEGKRARIKGTDSFFYHLQLLTESGRDQVHGLVTVHRSAIAPTYHTPNKVDSVS